MGEIKTGSWLSPLKLCILQWFQNKSMILTISILYKTSAYKCIPIGDSRVSIAHLIGETSLKAALQFSAASIGWEME